MAVDTLRHLLALHVTPANEQDHAQLAQLAEQEQDVTDTSVEVASVGQGDTGARARQDAADQRMQLEVVKRPASEERLRAAATALGGRAQFRLDRAL